jgi:hypothetical protein
MKKLLVVLVAAGAAVAFWRRKTLKEDAQMVQTKVVEGASKAQEKVTAATGGATVEVVEDLADDDAADAAGDDADDADDAAGADDAGAS